MLRRSKVVMWAGVVVVLGAALIVINLTLSSGPRRPTAATGASPGVGDSASAPVPTPGSPSPSVSASVSRSPSAKPSSAAKPALPAAPPPLSGNGCAPVPSFPDASCTGYAHTGVTLHTCSPKLVNKTYDSCLFNGSIDVMAPNIKVTRSKIVGVATYQSSDGSLHGLTLIDVEIDSSNDLGSASLGNNDYTCIRCNVHGGTRGINIGFNVTIRDSYSHGWHSHDGDHITGVGSNGGAHNVVDHNNISCDILNDPSGYACSSGMSVYGDDAPGNNDWTITDNLLNSASSYCMIIAGPPSKPYPFTNMRITGNHFGNLGARARGLPDSHCTEYGPVNQPDGVHQWNSGTTNVWSSNVDATGHPVDAPN